MLGQQALLQALAESNASVEDLRSALSGIDADALLSLMSERIRATLRAQPVGSLRNAQAHALFELLDDVQRLQQAIRRGANPNRDVLGDAFLVRYSRVLGAMQGGVTMAAITGDVGP